MIGGIGTKWVVPMNNLKEMPGYDRDEQAKVWKKFRARCPPGSEIELDGVQYKIEGKFACEVGSARRLPLINIVDKNFKILRKSSNGKKYTKKSIGEVRR